MAMNDSSEKATGTTPAARSMRSSCALRTHSDGWILSPAGSSFRMTGISISATTTTICLEFMPAPKRLMPWQETQVYFLARNYGTKGPNAIAPGAPGSPTTQRDIYTSGTLWKSDPEAFVGWDYSMEAALQFGSVFNAAQNDRARTAAPRLVCQREEALREMPGVPRAWGSDTNMDRAMEIPPTTRWRPSKTSSAPSTSPMV